MPPKWLPHVLMLLAGHWMDSLPAVALANWWEAAAIKSYFLCFTYTNITIKRSLPLEILSLQKSCQKLVAFDGLLHAYSILLHSSIDISLLLLKSYPQTIHKGNYLMPIDTR